LNFQIDSQLVESKPCAKEAMYISGK